MQLIETEIDALLELICEVLTDRKWNPRIMVASGDLRKGTDVDIEVQSNTEPTKSESRKMTPTITILDPRRMLQWKGQSVES